MASEIDPMERSKRELTRSIGTVVNHCVALSDGILREAGHGMVMNAARDFSKLDRTILDTMAHMKQTAAPLLELEENYDTMAGIEMMCARVESAAANPALPTGCRVCTGRAHGRDAGANREPTAHPRAHHEPRPRQNPPSLPPSVLI